MSSLNRRQFVSSALGGVASASLPWVMASRPVAAAMWDEPSIDALKSDLIYRSKAPRNGEPQLAKLAETWITPESQFYIRSHGPNPQVSVDDFVLKIEGLVEKPLTLSVPELLSKFPRVTCICTVSCAGIRRREFMKQKSLKGVDWAEGPIGNASWSGVKLSDVLNSVGIKAEAKHVWFEGADLITEGGTTFSFGASIPLSKLLEEDASMPAALLATQMNGKPLLPDHGFPLRGIVPGYIGARSVKWLRKITVSDKPSTNHYVADVYKMVYSQTQTEIDETAPIYRYPVNAAVCSAVIEGDHSHLRGYALPTGRKGCSIVRVELSIDGGQSWTLANLEKETGEFCWRLWTASLAVVNPETEICVRATDSLGNAMAETVPWNPKGYLYNAWHRVMLRDLK